MFLSSVVPNVDCYEAGAGRSVVVCVDSTEIATTVVVGILTADTLLSTKCGAVSTVIANAV